MQFTFGDEPANYGDEVTVTCSVIKGDLPIELSWLFNATPISHDSDVKIGSTSKKNSVLTIERVNARHAGEYTCTAANLAGSMSRSATLAVNGRFGSEIIFFH